MRQIEMVFKLDSEEQASIIDRSLQPEMKKDIPNTTINLIRDKNTLTLSISAKNTSALRAASNSYIRWIHTALNVTNSV